MGSKFLKRLRRWRNINERKTGTISHPSQLLATTPVSPSIESSGSGESDQDKHFVSLDKTRVITSSTYDHDLPSDVNGSSIQKIPDNNYMHSIHKDASIFTKECAFSGPPKYNWVDIETAAAVKIQSIFRRSKILTQLEKDGKSTVAMRNRIRSRNTCTRKTMSSEDVPNILRFCGIGFLFGEASREDPSVFNGKDEVLYEDIKRQRRETEERKRKFRMRGKGSTHNLEAVEVVHDVAL